MKRRVHARPEAKVQSEKEEAASSASFHDDVHLSANECRIEENDNMDTSTDEKRLCRAAGCTTPLTHLNSSGYCTRHFHFSRRKCNQRPDHTGGGRGEIQSSSSRNHRAVNDANSHTRDGFRDIKEDRLNQLILGWSLELKARLATDWLAGKI
jgi:hypothetical protein